MSETDPNGSFEDMFKRFDDLHFAKIKLNDDLLPVSSGSSEFQNARFYCDTAKQLAPEVTEQEEEPYRQRSKTIDSTYDKHNNHVHFAENLTSRRNKTNNIHNDRYGKIPGILVHHCDVIDQNTPRARSNTIDHEYRTNKNIHHVSHVESQSMHSKKQCTKPETGSGNSSPVMGLKHEHHITNGHHHIKTKHLDKKPFH